MWQQQDPHEGSGCRDGESEDTRWKASVVPVVPAELVQRLEILLGQRQALARQLAELVPTDPTRELLGQRFQQMSAEHEHLLHKLMSLLPPAEDRTV